MQLNPKNMEPLDLPLNGISLPYYLKEKMKKDICHQVQCLRLLI